ncbi:hypothetical protein [Reyranella sp.]|uniref:hypothetical protein n=1 Tax=Reyranella sp. TaxID=1929291 RepID=UPI003D0B3604
MPVSAPLSALPIVLRLIAAIGGGYAVAAGLAALLALTLPAVTPMVRSEAVVLSSMLAFPIYLALLIWAFAERRLLRLWLVLGSLGIASWGFALGLARLVTAS